NYLRAKKGAYVIGEKNAVVASSGGVDLVGGGDGESVDLVPQPGEDTYISLGKTAIRLRGRSASIILSNHCSISINATVVMINPCSAPNVTPAGAPGAPAGDIVGTLGSVLGDQLRAGWAKAASANGAHASS